MANIITSKTILYRTQKPPLGAQLNRSHPLSQGLVGVWMMNEGGGTIFKDLVGNNDGTGNGGNYWKKTSSGIGYSYPGGIKISGYKNLNKNGTISIVCLAKFQIFGNSQSLLNQDNYSSKRRLSLSFSYVSSNQFYLYGVLFFGGSPVSFSGVTNLFSNNKYYFCALTYNKKNLRLYVDNKIDYNSISYTSPIDSVDLAPNLMYDQATGFPLRDSMIFMYVWNRGLSPSEIQSLYVAPYQFIAPQENRFIISMGEAPTSSGITYSTATCKGVYTY